MDVENKLMKSCKDYLQVGFNMQTSIKLLLPNHDVLQACKSWCTFDELCASVGACACAMSVCVWECDYEYAIWRALFKFQFRFDNSLLSFLGHACIIQQWNCYLWLFMQNIYNP